MTSTLRKSLFLASGIAAFLFVAIFAVSYLHSNGVAQPLLACVMRLASLLGAPGLAIALTVVPPANHHLGTAGQIILICGAFGFYFVLGMYFFRSRRGSVRMSADERTEKEKSEDPVGATGTELSQTIVPAGMSRRRLLRIATGAGAARVVSTCGAGAVAYSLFFEPFRIEVTRHVLPLRGLPLELDGIRLVQITDIHHGPWLSIAHVERVIRIANSLTPDVILLTGDYVLRSTKYIDPVVSTFTAFKPKIGVVATLGNHDWWESVGMTRDAFRRVRIPLIDNDRTFLSSERKLTKEVPRQGLCIGGVGDFYEDEIDPDRAFRGVSPAMPRILISHNPDVAEEVGTLRDHRIDLMVSGHTHGGQVWIPGLGTPIVPSMYGQKYASGFVDGPRCRVYVSRGLGNSVLPMRFGVTPEITLFELKRA